MSDVPTPPRRWMPTGFGSIQSKLLVMLLVFSILSAGVVGFFAYRTGTTALREEAYERLTELRLERTTAIQNYIGRQKGSAIKNSRGLAIDALKAFGPAYEKLRGESITAQQKAKVTDYYTDLFVPHLQKNSQGTVQADSFVPTSPARTYLQALYTSSSDDFDESTPSTTPATTATGRRPTRSSTPSFVRSSRALLSTTS